MSTKPGQAHIAFAGTRAPAGWLLCDGKSLERTDEKFKRLYAAIGTSFGSTDAAHFKVPDLRGQFLRGADNGAGNDPDAKARTAKAGGTSGDGVGSLQADEFNAHLHPIIVPGHKHGLNRLAGYGPGQLGHPRQQATQAFFENTSTDAAPTLVAVGSAGGSEATQECRHEIHRQAMNAGGTES